MRRKGGESSHSVKKLSCLKSIPSGRNTSNKNKITQKAKPSIWKRNPRFAFFGSFLLPGVSDERKRNKSSGRRGRSFEKKRILEMMVLVELTPSSLASAREEYFVGRRTAFGRSCLGRRVKCAPVVIRRFPTGFGGRSQGGSAAVVPVLRL